MKITIDEYTVESVGRSVSIYNESGSKKAHFPTKEPVTDEADLRELYKVFQNYMNSMDTYLEAKGVEPRKKNGLERD